MEIKRKDGITYNRNNPRGTETIPSKDKYTQTINKLATDGRWDVLIAVRMGCEMGMARIDIVNAEVKNIDKNNPRTLWVEVSKLVHRGKKDKQPVYKMRSRDLPINPSLYSVIMNYIDKNQKYILKRKRGDIAEPFDEQYINQLYKDGNVPWSPHKSRHYFRSQVKQWMRISKCMDDEVVDTLMGHRPRGVRESYGIIDSSYKSDIVDKVFG